MRKASFGITIALILTLAGCGGGDEPETDRPESKPVSTSEPSTMASPDPATPDDAAALRAAVERYAQILLAGDVDAAMASMTALCARGITVGEGTEIMEIPDLGLGSDLGFATYTAEIEGDSATVSYTYAKAHPLNVRNEPWHREDGTWRNDYCWV